MRELFRVLGVLGPGGACSAFGRLRKRVRFASVCVPVSMSEISKPVSSVCAGDSLQPGSLWSVDCEHAHVHVTVVG